MNAGIQLLNDRSMLRIGGNDAEHFLDNLVTCEVASLAVNDVRFGALLTPQGKILFDFFLVREASGFLIDTDRQQASELVKRLTFYKLRADVTISEVSEIRVASSFSEPSTDCELSVTDPRHPDMGNRIYGSFDQDLDQMDLTEKRIDIGIAQSGTDFQLGDAYPHEVLMDQFGGVAFKKGCYVGQEVVSRMQHKTKIRKRVVKLTSNEALPSTGTSITADGKVVGTIGSVLGNKGLAIVRLDRIANAQTIDADGISINVSLPDWVSFSWPGID